MGSITFSNAENSGSRKWNWKTKPMCALRARVRSASLAERHELLTEPDLAAVGAVEQAQQVEKRALAAAAGAHYGVGLARLQDEVHPAQGVRASLVAPKPAFHTGGAQENGGGRGGNGRHVKKG
jgi:hypothetical protein